MKHTKKLKILSVPPTTEERVLIAVVSAVVVAVAQVFREDADVGGVTLDLAVGTNPVGCNRKRSKHAPQNENRRTSGGFLHLR